MWGRDRTALTRCPVCRATIANAQGAWTRHLNRHTFGELFAYGWDGPAAGVFRGLVAGCAATATVLLAAAIAAARPFTWGSVIGLTVGLLVWPGLALWHLGAPRRLPRLRATAFAAVAGAAAALAVLAVTGGLGWPLTVLMALMALVDGRASLASWRNRRGQE